MEINALKIELINWLQGLNDKSVLTSLLQVKKASEAGDFLSTLSPSQLESLQKGLSDAENNRVISNKDFWAAYGKKV